MDVAFWPEQRGTREEESVLRWTERQTKRKLWFSDLGVATAVPMDGARDQEEDDVLIWLLSSWILTSCQPLWITSGRIWDGRKDRPKGRYTFLTCAERLECGLLSKFHPFICICRNLLWLVSPLRRNWSEDPGMWICETRRTGTGLYIGHYRIRWTRYITQETNQTPCTMQNRVRYSRKCTIGTAYCILSKVRCTGNCRVHQTPFITQNSAHYTRHWTVTAAQRVVLYGEVYIKWHNGTMRCITWGIVHYAEQCTLLRKSYVTQGILPYTVHSTLHRQQRFTVRVALYVVTS